MRISVFIVSILAMSLASCSTCYECAHDVEIWIDYNGNGIEDPGETEISEETTELCTADRSEVDDLESVGYSCQ